ncbi:MAG: hypothetical protein WKG06_27770 [Segetibacter sp.]
MTFNTITFLGSSSSFPATARNINEKRPIDAAYTIINNYLNTIAG